MEAYSDQCCHPELKGSPAHIVRWFWIILLHRKTNEYGKKQGQRLNAEEKYCVEMKLTRYNVGAAPIKMRLGEPFKIVCVRTVQRELCGSKENEWKTNKDMEGSDRKGYGLHRISQDDSSRNGK